MKSPKYPILLGLGILFSFFSLNAQNKQSAAIPPQDSIKKWQDEYKVPIVAVGIIEDGKIKETKVYGESKPGVPAPQNTFFNIASLTKPVVAMLTVKLVSMGKWNLDEPIYKYWTDPDVANDLRHKKLTTRLILSHQTGLPNWRWQNDSKKLDFKFEPGTEVKYSGEGFMYLKRALENKFGLPLEKLTDSLVFVPSGMKNTRFYWDSTTKESLYANRHDENGKALEMEKWYEANAANLVLTTIEDFSRFAISVLQKDGISNRVYKEMITPQAPKGKSISLSGNKNIPFGLSWALVKDLSNGEFALVHGGRNPGINTTMLLLPKSKRGIIVFTNGENGSALYNKIISNSMDLGNEILERLK